MTIPIGVGTRSGQGRGPGAGAGADLLSAMHKRQVPWLPPDAIVIFTLRAKAEKCIVAERARPAGSLILNSQ